jgi:GWxTD domain-containing protein
MRAKAQKNKNSHEGLCIERSIHRLIIIFAFAWVLLDAPAIAQQQGSRSRNDDRTQPQQSLFSFDAVNLPADSASGSRLDIYYRLSYDFFIFTHKDSAQAPFTAEAELTVEILNSAGNSVARRLIRNVLGAAEPRSPTSEKAYLQGIFSFSLFPGDYTIVTDVKDGESNRRYLDRNKKITLIDFSYEPVLGDPIFAEAHRSQADSIIHPFNIGGDVAFGENFDCCLELASSAPPDSQLMVVKLSDLNNENNTPIVVLQDTLKRDKLAPCRNLSIGLPDSSTVSYRVVHGQRGRYLLRFFVQGDTLREGDYRLDVNVKSGTTVDSLKRNFQIRWFDKPRSLRSLDIAVDAMQYLLDDSTYKQLKRLRGKERQDEFDRIWKQRDPTPRTAFNEAMAEYYLRVDYATSAFSTLQEDNGLRTDRGRSYLNFGPPEKTERNFNPNSNQQEIWYYPNLHKKLIFEDNSRDGNFILVAIDKI